MDTQFRSPRTETGAPPQSEPTRPLETENSDVLEAILAKLSSRELEELLATTEFARSSSTDNGTNGSKGKDALEKRAWLIYKDLDPDKKDQFLKEAEQAQASISKMGFPFRQN